MKILIASSEVVPFAKTGGLADVAGALPSALEDAGQEVVVVMPFYKLVRQSKAKIQKSEDGLSYAVIGKKVKVYFIEEDLFFDRDGLYGGKHGDFQDNLDRFSFYGKSVLYLLKKIDFKPDIIHIHDWQACLIPVYLKHLYADDPFYKGIHTVLTIHNIGYQGLFPKEEFSKLGLEESVFGIDGLEYYGKINLLKGGMEYADVINTVSPTYSKEIQTKEFGFGLEGVLNKRKDSLFGILNGLDYTIWNPQTDTYISDKYSSENPDDKVKNKEDLQRTCGLPLRKDVPLFGIVSRLAEQKGFDILAEAIEKICAMDLQLVILGTGDVKYHALLEK
ncbi:MAG: glycogen synthase, partial [Candidatus Omnitrophica bacterium]|nr:glycogen synthase [Candidatus Omnitrophota bacterium]